MTERKTDEELRLLHIAACGRVQLGAIYQHKKTGRHYVAQKIDLRKGDLEPMVSYAPLAQPRGVSFSCTLEEFLGKNQKLPADHRR